MKSCSEQFPGTTFRLNIPGFVAIAIDTGFLPKPLNPPESILIKVKAFFSKGRNGGAKRLNNVIMGFALTQILIPLCHQAGAQ